MIKIERTIVAVVMLFHAIPANADVENVVMALTRAQWQAELSDAPVSDVMKDVADEYTEFNPQYPTRLDGKALNTLLAEVYHGDNVKTVVAEMVNPKVQVYGDVAILSYNYVGAVQAADGTIQESTTKSTRVYAKIGKDWMLVHANFAPLSGAQPER